MARLLATTSLSALVLYSAAGATTHESNTRVCTISTCQADGDETALMQTVSTINTDRQGSTASPASSHDFAEAESFIHRRREILKAEPLEPLAKLKPTNFTAIKQNRHEGPGALSTEGPFQQPPFTEATAAVVPGPTPSLVARIFVIVAIAAACSALIAFLLCRCMPKQRGDPGLWEICYTQLFSLLAVALAMWGHLTPLTTAYDMMMSIGYGAASSGLIIGAYFALGVPALLLTMRLTKPWNQSVCWTTCLCCLAVTGSAQLGFMAISVYSSSMMGILCLWLLMLVRAVMGFASAIVETMAKLMAQRVTPKENMLGFQVQYSSAVVLGMAMGPLLSSAVSVATSAQNPGTRLGNPSGFVGLLWLATIPFLWFFVPKNLDANRKNDTPAQTISKPGTASVEYVPVERKVIWWSAVGYDLERMVSQVAIEVAASFILEVEFHWHPTQIGLVVSSGFLLGVPINEVFLLARRRSTMSDNAIARMFAILGALASLLLWPGLGTALFEHDIVTIMLAEIIMFSSLRISKSVVDALSVEFAVPGSFYSQENCLIGQRFLTFTLGRFLAPPATRFVLQNYGRLCYMLIQLCLSCLGSMTVFKATQAAERLRAAHNDGKEGRDHDDHKSIGDNCKNSTSGAN